MHNSGLIVDSVAERLDAHYKSFNSYVGNEEEPSRKMSHAGRSNVRKRFMTLLSDYDFENITSRKLDEEQYKQVYEIFDVVTQKSFQPGKQHYYGFFGAARCYKCEFGTARTPSPNVVAKFSGDRVDQNVRSLHRLLYAEERELRGAINEYLRIPYIGMNSATAFLMYRNPSRFTMLNIKPIGSIQRLGINVKKTSYSYDDYIKLLLVCSEIVNHSRKYDDGGFVDFLDLDWFFHLLYTEKIGGFYPSRSVVEAVISAVAKGKRISKKELFERVEEECRKRDVGLNPDWKEKTWENTKKWAQRIIE